MQPLSLCLAATSDKTIAAASDEAPAAASNEVAADERGRGAEATTVAAGSYRALSPATVELGQLWDELGQSKSEREAG